MASRFTAPFYDVGNGISPSDGAKLTFFISGTSTLKNTFTSADEGTPHTNPVIADSDGVFPAIFIDGTYKITLQDKNDVQIYEEDPYKEIGETTGVDTFTDLRALDRTQFVNGESFVHVLGHTTIGDRGNDHFWYNGVGSAPEDDDGVTVIATDGARWQRLHDGFISITDFGADPVGSIDATAAIQAAIDFYPTGNGTIYFPPGTYKVTSTILINQNGIHLIGAGKRATTIDFAPTANDTCINADRGAIISYGSIEGMTLFSSDSTFEKVGLDLASPDNWIIRDFMIDGSVSVGGSSIWGGGAGGSTGILTRGHQVNTFMNLSIFADKPIFLEINPYVFLDCDHFNFHNCFFIAGQHPHVECSSSFRQITNLTFTGYQAWVGGTDGFKWIDAASVGVSQTIVFNNVRWENALPAGGFCININHLNGIQQLSVNNCQGTGDGRDGMFLRGITNLNLINNIWPGPAPRIHLDLDAVRGSFNIIGNFWQSGGTVNLNGNQQLAFGLGILTGQLPATAFYNSIPVDRNWINRELAESGRVITLANDGIETLGTNSMKGRLLLTTSDNRIGEFYLSGTNNVSFKTQDPAVVFSTTKGNAGTYNVYRDGTTTDYELENKSGNSRQISIVYEGRDGGL